jgi:hypothetical protein
MLEKSQGQFIYTKYAFEDLADKPQWTLAELAVRLPQGLGGIYKYILRVLDDALEVESPRLRELLRGKLLPVLVVCR